ncbi:MAG: RNA degradosome polyphosphate kinase, partial [Acidobacteria bacterium]|nr:RNA degradosome polyphosphate kinase [Acidobacteriota bacterium]
MKHDLLEFERSREDAGIKQASPISVRDPQYLLNRELSWLEFNRRVLGEALDPSVPLLERLKFLSIFSTNLDEFFMIRVSGLKEQIAEGINELSPDGRTAGEQLREIRHILRPMLIEQMFCLNEEILPQLAEKGISIASYKDLEEKHQRNLNEYFQANIFPMLTPQAVDESHPFPYVSNLSVNLGAVVKRDKKFDHGKLSHLFNENRFVRIKLPPRLPRLIPIDESETRFVSLDEIIAANIKALFPNMKPNRASIFRVTRDA